MTTDATAGISSKVPNKCDSSSGASHKPAKKPKMTLGNEAMTSTDGLTKPCTRGEANSAV